MSLAMQGYGGSFDPGSSDLFDLHVLRMTGQEFLLKVPPTMLGREVRQIVSKKFPSKRGAKLVLHHGTSELALNQTMEEQGIVREAGTLSCTHVPANLFAARCFVQGLTTCEEALEGLTHMTLKQPGQQHWNYLPETLESLTFGTDFNQGLCDMHMLTRLQSLTFGARFNQSLDRVTLPPSLETLTFGADFNQGLEAVTLPASLQALTLGRGFSHSLEGVTLPPSLETLAFQSGIVCYWYPDQGNIVTFGFNNSLERVILPSNLQTLTFGDRFNQSLERVILPSNLQTLTFGDRFNQSLDRVTLPPSLETLTFGADFNQGLEAVTDPPSQSPTVDSGSWLQPQLGGSDSATQS